MDKHTAELLRRAFRTGPYSFLSEVGTLAKNRLYGATPLVFEIRKQDRASIPGELNDSLSSCPYETWGAVPEEMKAALARDLNGRYWGKGQWMQLGWRLWIGTMDRDLAVVSCRDYNTSSRKAIEKAGFPYIGRGVIRKTSGKGAWYPVAKPFTQG